MYGLMTDHGWMSYMPTLHGVLMGLRAGLLSVGQDYGLEGYINFPPCNKRLSGSQHALTFCFALQYSSTQGEMLSSKLLPFFFLLMPTMLDW